MKHNNVKDSHMTTLSGSIDNARGKGFKSDFIVTENGLQAINGKKTYRPEEVEIKDFHRFEGESDPEDSSILYYISTKDGVKGTLTDAYGMYADPRVSDFMEMVTSIKKNRAYKKAVRKLKITPLYMAAFAVGLGLVAYGLLRNQRKMKPALA